MKTEIWVALWSVDTKIQKNGNESNVLRALSMTERVNLLGRVVEKAYASVARAFIESLPDNISEAPPRWALMFVAPEYLFARSDREHLIGEDEKRDVVLRLQALSRKWQEMILVPGTIAWKKPAERPIDKRFKKDPRTGLRTGPEKPLTRFAKFTERTTRAGMERYRLARHGVDQQFAGYAPHIREAMEPQRQGAIEQAQTQALEEPAKLARALAEKLNSAPERCFLARNTLYAFYNGAEVGRYHKRADYYEVFPSESDDGYIVFEPGAPGDGHPNHFEANQIRFGVEICKDHAAGYLSQLSGGSRPDVQVLVSAATPLVTEHVFVNPGCFVVHASSDPECTGVWTNTGSGVTEVKTKVEATGVGGSVLHYARLQFDSADPVPELQWPI
jgi:predicted amidohydrolase